MTAVHILEFILIMIVLVVLHEMGHMVVAKWCGMRVERFSVFFGRPLWSFTKGETQYGIGWLPLGGYVKITGMSREELFDREYDAEGRMVSETPVAPEIAARAYCNSTTPRKVATILAGPMANVLVAIVLFAVSFWVGVPQFDRTNEVASVAIGKPADVANLQAGDRILSINGVKPATDNIDAMAAQIESNVGRTITVVVQRDGSQRSVKVGPLVPDAKDTTIGRLGVTFQQDVVATDRYSFFGGLGKAVTFTGELTKAQVVALGKMFTDKTTREQLSGAVGIGAAYNDNVQYGIGQVLLFSGLISLILAIMNLIPLLPLDGGHIVFALAERVRGRNLSMAVYQRASVVGIALVLLLAFYGFSNDISHLTGSGTRP